MSDKSDLNQFDTGKLAGHKTDRGYNQSTASGLPFWALDPRPEDIRISDIIAQLSRICRFGGAIRSDIDIYTVAQHCCLVSDHCPPDLRFEGLMHDAHEAYCGDMVKPIKMNLGLAAATKDEPWKALEHRLEKAVRLRFGLPEDITPEVKRQDYLAVATEHRDIQIVTGKVDWGELPEPWYDLIVPWSIRQARYEFERRFLFYAPKHVLQEKDIFNLKGF